MKTLRRLNKQPEPSQRESPFSNHQDHIKFYIKGRERPPREVLVKKNPRQAIGGGIISAADLVRDQVAGNVSSPDYFSIADVDRGVNIQDGYFYKRPSKHDVMSREAVAQKLAVDKYSQFSNKNVKYAGKRLHQPYFSRKMHRARYYGEEDNIESETRKLAEILKGSGTL